MAEFRSAVPTEKGVALIAKVLAGRCNINFTKIATGNGSYSDGEDVSKRTALKAQKQTFPISSSGVLNQNTVHIKYIVSNVNTDGTSLDTGYYVKEVGIFANDPDEGEILYSIAVAQTDKWDYLPAYNGMIPSTITMDWYVEVANASQVTIQALPGAYVLQEDFEALEKRVTQTEMASAACIGIRRKCQEDGTPQSATTWERWGQYTDAVVKFATGTEAVQNDLMSKWPYNLLRPCNLPLDSEDPVAYLGDPDFDWYGADGVAEGTSVMLEVPTDMYMAHWYEKDAGGQLWEYKCVADSGRYPGSVYVKDLMARSDGTRRDYFYFPIFLGSINSAGNFVSVAGAVPAYNKSCTAMRTAVKTNGDNWQLIDVWAWEILSDLGEIMSANANFRSTYGNGCSSFGSSSDMISLSAKNSTNIITISDTFRSRLRVGMNVNVGNAVWNASVCQDRTITDISDSSDTADAFDITLSGEPFNVLEGSVVWRCAQITGSTIEMASPNGTAGENDGLHSVRMLYIEDFWGMLHTGVDGLNLKFNEAKMGLEMYVCQDPSKYADNYDNYEMLPEILSLDAENSEKNYELSGYIKQEHYFEDYPLLEMPKALSGGAGSTTYLAAYCWKNKNGQRPFFGGSFSNGSNVSPRARYCDAGFSHSNWNYGSRPLRR